MNKKIIMYFNNKQRQIGTIVMDYGCYFLLLHHDIKEWRVYDQNVFIQ